jgi:hypothetical protein
MYHGYCKNCLTPAVDEEYTMGMVPPYYLVYDAFAGNGLGTGM